MQIHRVTSVHNQLLQATSPWVFPSRPAISSGPSIGICVEDDELVALYGFIKKTEKTPDAELKLAKKRMKEVKRS